MKKIYVLLFFMIMVNLVSIMFATQHIFDTSDQHGNQYTQNMSGSSDGEKIFGDITSQNFGDVIYIFLGGASGILGFLTTASVSIAAAWLTHSPAPFVVGMIAGTFLTMYNNTSSMFSEYSELNSFVFLACSLGMVFIFIITCAEYLTQGDA